MRFTGHAVEARICAEDPARGFLPSGGTVLALREPHGDGVRIDSGLTEGTEVGSLYDPMLSKVIAHGPDRPTALRRLRAALADTVILGVPTNAAFLRELLAHPDVVAGTPRHRPGRAGRRVADAGPGAGGGLRRGGPDTGQRHWNRPAARAAGSTRSRCRAAGDWAASPPGRRIRCGCRGTTR